MFFRLFSDQNFKRKFPTNSKRGFKFDAYGENDPDDDDDDGNDNDDEDDGDGVMKPEISPIPSSPKRYISFYSRGLINLY